MSDAAILDQSVFTALSAENAYLPKNKELRALQIKQLAAFLQRGLPTRREELWKYTDMSFLAKQEWVGPQKQSSSLKNTINGIRFVFVNGYFSPELSDLSLLPDNVTLCSLSERMSLPENNTALMTEFDAQRYPFAALNTALMTDGFYLSVPSNVMLSETIHCLFLSSKQNNAIICPRNIIVVGANSQITLIEEYVSDNAENYFINTVTQIHAESGAKLNYHKIQSESDSATHVANIFVTQKQDSVIKSFCLDTGARLAREDLMISLLEPGAECSLNGFYKLTTDKQHVDNHIHVDHFSAHGKSSMLYKGTLDKKSHAVFNGKVFVHKDAQKITAQQGNHNLLLSTDAQIDTKPELEIYADDVKCSHGATVGQLNAESLFYLQARGIEKNQAMLLLTQAFADDVMKAIAHPEIKQYIQQRAGHYAE